MIRISVKHDEIRISGHADYDEFGKDIVCASVSSIAITTVNAILRLEDTIEFESKDGLLVISILKHTKVTDTLITNMISLFEELEKQYSENVQIKY